MSRVIKTLRNNWKKSIFFTVAGSYGVNWAKIKYEDNQLMKRMCAEALKFGEVSTPLSVPLFNVTVILNPVASKGGARQKYEDFCAPILNLAGIRVSVIRTEAEGQAKDIMEIMKDADAVLIAGGDGSVMEAVTGLLRRPDGENLRTTLPLGILPVGNNNNLAKSLFPDVETKKSDVALMAHSAMACVKQLHRPVDVMQVENLSDDPVYAGKKLYGLTELQLGAFRDAHNRLSKYWYWARLKKAMAYVFAYTSSANHVLWNCLGSVEIARPIETEPALQNSHEELKDTKTWWEYFFGKSGNQREQKNPNPIVQRINFEWEKINNFKGIEFSVKSPNFISLSKEGTNKSLQVTLGPEEMSFTEFVSQGWKRENQLVRKFEDNENWRNFETSRVRFYPQFPDQKEEEIENEVKGEKKKNKVNKCFSLDNEEVEVIGPLEVSLLPDKIVMFCSESINLKPDQRQQQQNLNIKWWQSSGKSKFNLVSDRF